MRQLVLAYVINGVVYCAALSDVVRRCDAVLL
jgi:hypothetical protein